MNNNSKWYIIKIITGNEEKILNYLYQVKENIIPNLFDKLFYPIKIINTFNNGKLIIKKEKIYPGYIFIKMVYLEKNIKFIKNISKIIGFIGGKKPLNISLKQINKIKNNYLINNKNI